MSDNKYPAQAKLKVLSQDDVIERLKHAFAFDFLDVDEFEKRLVKATGTKNQAELNVLVADLPEMVEKETPVPQAGKSQVKESGTLFAMMSGISKRGNWKPPRNLKVVTIMGGVDLNFTKVNLPPGTTEVSIFSLMGGVDIIIPPGVNVDVSGFAIMGGFDDHSFHDQEYPGAPTLKIRGFAFMAGVDIRPPKQSLLERILRKFHLH